MERSGARQRCAVTDTLDAMTQFHVRSNDGADLLIERDDSPDAWWWSVTLTAEGASGSASRIDAESRHTPPLSSFFSDLARDWRGWDGAKTWDSIEGVLRLSATHDGIGHVSIRVTLQSSTSPDAWALDATLNIDAGALDMLARDASSFATA